MQIPLIILGVEILTIFHMLEKQLVKLWPNGQIDPNADAAFYKVYQICIVRA